MFGSKELDEKLYSGRMLGTMLFGATVRHLRRDMRLIDSLEKKKVVHHAQLGNISKTKKDLDAVIKWFQKFEADSRDAIQGMVKFENYELGNVQSLEEFVETLQKLGFPEGIISADSSALMLILRALQKDFKVMREHFGILEDKTGSLIKQFEERQKTAVAGMQVARSQAARFQRAAGRTQRRIG
jgi:hypothetical protein